MKALLWTAVAFLSLYGLYLAVLFAGQRAMLYPGAATTVGSGPPQVPGLEVAFLQTPIGRVETLFLPAFSGQQPEPVVIFTHGNGEVTDFWVSALDGFRQRGIGVLLVEYPGYGRTPGSPSEASIRAAVDAAYDHIAVDPRVDRQRIFGFGRSLGGGAICLLAHDRPLRALILESTFPSMAIFARRYWAPSFLLRDRFDNESVLHHFEGPVLVIHGDQDQLIPWQQGQRLAAASAQSEFKLYHCGHGCWDPEHDSFWQDAVPFLAKAGII